MPELTDDEVRAKAASLLGWMPCCPLASGGTECGVWRERNYTGTHRDAEAPAE